MAARNDTFQSDSLLVSLEKMELDHTLEQITEPSCLKSDAFSHCQPTLYWYGLEKSGGFLFTDKKMLTLFKPFSNIALLVCSSEKLS